MVTLRRELVWDYEIPDEPEKDEGFLTLYVGRVLDRGTAEDVRSLGLGLIRRTLDRAPARREVIEFWRWWLERSAHGDSHRGAAAVSAGGGDDRGGPR